MNIRLHLSESVLTGENTRVTTRISQSLDRLSTGIRVNANSQYEQSQTSDISGLTSGSTAAQSQLSRIGDILELAEASLYQMVNAVDELRSIAVRAADSTLSYGERQVYQNRFEAGVEELDQMAKNVRYGGHGLFDGSFFNERVVAFADNINTTISLDFIDARAANLGQVALVTTGTDSDAANSSLSLNLVNPSGIAVNDITLTGFSSDGVSDVEANASALAYANAFNQGNNVGVYADVVSNYIDVDYNSGAALAAGATMKINGHVVKSSSDPGVSLGNDSQARALVNLINEESSSTGVIASIDTSTNSITFSAEDGRNINIEFSGQADLNVFGLTGSSTEGNYVQRGAIQIYSDSAMRITGAGAELFSGQDVRSVAIDESTSLSHATLSTFSDAQSAIGTLNHARRQLQANLEHVQTQKKVITEHRTMQDLTRQNRAAVQSALADARQAGGLAESILIGMVSHSQVTISGQANSSTSLATNLLSNISI